MSGLRARIAHVLRSPRFWPAACVGFAIAASSQVPGSALPEQPFFGFDKVVHACFYTSLCLAFAAMPGRKRWLLRPFRMALLVFLATALFGAADEWHQSLVEGRTTSLDDWIVDASMGLFFSCAALLAALRARRKR